MHGALVFTRLTGGATILFGLLVAISIVAPSFQASEPTVFLLRLPCAIPFSAPIHDRIHFGRVLQQRRPQSK
jgi:hypothetical protein